MTDAKAGKLALERLEAWYYNSGKLAQFADVPGAWSTRRDNYAEVITDLKALLAERDGLLANVEELYLVENVSLGEADMWRRDHALIQAKLSDCEKEREEVVLERNRWMGHCDNAIHEGMRWQERFLESEARVTTLASLLLEVERVMGPSAQTARAALAEEETK